MKFPFKIIFTFVVLISISFVNIPDDYSHVNDWVDETLKSMSLREKVAQMIISHSLGFNLDNNPEEFNRLKKLIE